MGRLQGKVAIITGGAAGIGKATVERFVAEGAKVISLDIDNQGLENLRSQDIESIAINIYDEPRVKQCVDSITSKYGGIDILVNNAARFVLKGIDASQEEWQESFSVNVFGAANCTKYISEVMASQGEGVIVNLASISGIIAQPQFLTYSTTKAAIIQMTKNLALDLGKRGIRVNCISPGTIITSASEKHVTKLGITLDDFKKLEGDKTALGKVGSPEDVANAVLFLASEEASFITGANLMVDGGYTII